MSNIFNLGVCVCVYVCTHTRAKSFSHVRLCDRIDCSRQGPLSMGILQAKILKWVAMPYSRGSSQPRDQTQVYYTVGGFFTIWATKEAVCKTTKWSRR